MATGTAGDCLPDDTLLELVQGQLSCEDAEVAERHLDRCALCRKLVAEAARFLVAEESGHTRGDTVPEGQPWGAPALAAPPVALVGLVALEPGAQLGRYVIEDVLGEGAMGVVYNARDPRLNRRVALKSMRGDSDKASPMRLLREAQAMAKLAHPNVVTVYDAEVVGGEVFVAMELVPGDTLASWLAEGARSWREILAVFIDAGRGLAAAHAVGLVHRDFKPDNVLVGTDGRARVTDFGLARSARVPALPGRGADLPLDGEASLTTTGQLIGTPAYMAPEQFRLEIADARTDQFSFCVALWAAMYRERPFEAGSVEELAESVIRGRVRPAPTRADVPPGLRPVLLRGLATERDDRYPSMTELLDALAGCAASPRRAPRVSIALGAVLVAAGAALAVHLFTGERERERPGPAAAPAPPAVRAAGDDEPAAEASPPEAVVEAAAPVDQAPAPRRRVKRSGKKAAEPDARKPDAREPDAREPDVRLIEDPWREASPRPR